jgi:glycolate oxidase FAD binding subunit
MGGEARSQVNQDGETRDAVARAEPRSAEDVRDAVRDACDRESPLRIVGRGTWLRGGRPAAAAKHLDVSGVSGIVEYVPGDLTLTARAGTSLAEIEAATLAHHQWLPLDPFGDPRGSLGGTLATASAGPAAGSVGRPRDVAVGLTFVTGDAQVVHAGGRVVKNVAGFDLVRLTIGAWGTLGVIVDATVRLRAIPDADETVSLTLPEEPMALAAFLAALRQAPVDPLCAELLSDRLAARLALGTGAVVLIRLTGNRVAVRHQRDVLARLGPITMQAPETWRQLRASDPPDAFIVRVSRRPSELPRLWGVATSLPGAEAHATLSRGIVRLRIPGDHRATWEHTEARFDAADVRIVEQDWLDRAPPTDTPVADDPLSDRLRLAFDPHRVLNRGILGGGA